MSTVERGRAGEKVAIDYLRKKGFKIIETGYRLFRGEIDIIALDNETVVFIEVKTRTGQKFGRPEESVTAAKQRQIKKIALGYLTQHKLENVNCRFDVISLDNDLETGSPVLIHFEDAF